MALAAAIPQHPVLDLQAAVGNAAVTRLLARDITGADRPAMATRWGKTKADQKTYLQSLGPEQAYKEIEAFCKSRSKRKNPPTIAEVIADLGLEAKDVAQPAAKPKRAEGFSFNLDLTDTGTVKTGFDDHQNKHQITKIHGLKDYSGGEAENKYGSYADADWHRRNTAPIAARWVQQLDAEGKLDPPGTIVHSKTGENFFKEGHLFVASATKDDAGVLYCSYHCYPEVSD